MEIAAISLPVNARRRMSLPERQYTMTFGITRSDAVDRWSTAQLVAGSCAVHCCQPAMTASVSLSAQRRTV